MEIKANRCYQPGFYWLYCQTSIYKYINRNGRTCTLYAGNGVEAYNILNYNNKNIYHFSFY